MPNRVSGRLRRICVGVAAFEREGHAEAGAIGRLAGHCRSVLHAGNRSDVGENVAVIGGDDLGIFGAGFRHREERR